MTTFSKTASQIQNYAELNTELCLNINNGQTSPKYVVFKSRKQQYIFKN